MTAMGADQTHDWQALAATAIEWWSDAGVDVLVDDAPRDWLARPVPVAATAASVVAATAGDAVAPALPDTIEAFVAWRSGTAAPEAAWNAPMFVGEGPVSADIMVAIDCADADGLLTGAAGLLFDRMLAAIGRDRASVYLAPLAVARPLAGRIAPEVEAVLSPMLRHHVALAAPKRLLVMGAAASRAIFGANGAVMRATLQTVNLNGTNVEAVVGLTPSLLLERPAAKAESWKGLQMLVGGLN